MNGGIDIFRYSQNPSISKKRKVRIAKPNWSPRDYKVLASMAILIFSHNLVIKLDKLKSSFKFDAINQ